MNYRTLSLFLGLAALTEVHGGLASAIAKSTGRAGRVKTVKRRSEAPKRSRTIECRSDAGRHYRLRPAKTVAYCESKHWAGGLAERRLVFQRRPASLKL